MKIFAENKISEEIIEISEVSFLQIRVPMSKDLQAWEKLEKNLLTKESSHVWHSFY